MFLNRKTIFYFLLLIILLLIGYLFFFVTTDSYQCMSNPLVYGVQKAVTNDYFSCRCSTLSSNKELLVTPQGMVITDKLSFYNDTSFLEKFNNFSTITNT